MNKYNEYYTFLLMFESENLNMVLNLVLFVIDKLSKTKHCISGNCEMAKALMFQNKPQAQVQTRFCSLAATNCASVVLNRLITNNAESRAKLYR